MDILGSFSLAYVLVSISNQSLINHKEEINETVHSISLNSKNRKLTAIDPSSPSGCSSPIPEKNVR